jgi:RimJ/RimL family protein N-acetyltransferase
MAPAFPLLPAQVRKKYEKIDKQVDENGNLFYFMIRARGDERLLGFTCIEWVSWTTGSAHFNIGIGNPQDRRRGYGSEALQMMLRYAFNELNLYRLSVFFSGDNQEALRFFQKHGFSEEARLRQALQRDGCFWDVLHLGLLSTEWQARPPTSETH